MSENTTSEKATSSAISIKHSRKSSSMKKLQPICSTLLFCHLKRQCCKITRRFVIRNWWHATFGNCMNSSTFFQREHQKNFRLCNDFLLEIPKYSDNYKNNWTQQSIYIFNNRKSSLSGVSLRKRQKRIPISKNNFLVRKFDILLQIYTILYFFGS